MATNGQDHAEHLTSPCRPGRAALGLSGAEPQDGEPSVADLAERIKALNAANNVEAAPQRAGVRRTSAEEPVTARIRRRAEEAIGPADGEAETGHVDRLASEPRTAIGRA